MTGTSIDDLHRQWLDRPGYKEAYDALEQEFTLASTLIKARTSTGLTQAQLAERMHAAQTVIARLESGRAKPSTRTLERFSTDHSPTSPQRSHIIVEGRPAPNASKIRNGPK